MRKELDEELVKKYPKIFANRFGDMRTTAMCWGFECGDGWYNIIDALCSNLQWNTDKNNRDGKYPQVVATQVKEKFGGLRFYVEGASDLQYSVINFVESLSYKVCEECGSMKDIGRTKGWIKTLCKKCAEGNDNWISIESKDSEDLP